MTNSRKSKGIDGVVDDLIEAVYGLRLSTIHAQIAIRELRKKSTWLLFFRFTHAFTDSGMPVPIKCLRLRNEDFEKRQKRNASSKNRKAPKALCGILAQDQLRERYPILIPDNGFYVDRAFGRDCDHRPTRRGAAPCSESGQAAGPLHQRGQFGSATDDCSPDVFR